MNDHSAGITEPQRLACQNTSVRSAWAPPPKPSVRPATSGMHSTGTSWRCSARCITLSVMRCRRGVAPVDVVLGRVGAGPVHEVRHGGAVDVGQRCLCGRVVDEDESVGLLVRPVRGVHRDVHALLDDLALDRTLEVEALAHRRRGL